MSRDPHDATEEQPLDAMPAGYQLEYLFHTRLSITTFLISASQTAAIVLFVAVSPLYGLAAVDALRVDYFPEAVQQPTRESGLHVAVRLIYLIGPLMGVVSVGIYQCVKSLERIVRLNAAARRAKEDPATSRLLNETLALVQKRSTLGDQVSNWVPGDPAYDAYREADSELDRKKRQLLGPTPVALLTLFVLITLNWYALGLQAYYGIQWGFFSKWLSVPVLAVWFVGLLICTIAPIRGRR